MALLIVAWPAATSAQRLREGTVERERCADHQPLRRALFGDLHVHTGFSLDASTMGTRIRPAEAYAFAQGSRLGIQPYDAQGRAMRTLQLDRPIDFAAVTDHAELIGETHICRTPGAEGHDSLVCRVYRNFPRVAFFWMNTQANRAVRHGFCGEDAEICLEAAATPWNENREATEAAYDRSDGCTFTSFHGYEWTGGAGSGNNFHRNVIFANDVVPSIPISFIDAPVLTDFWSRLDRECRSAGTGCDVLVIPHNSNLSAGRMFRTTLPDGSPIPASEAELRARFERLVEVMQHKGESECMFGLDTEDELCQFENLAQNSFLGRFLPLAAEPPMPRQFVRNILKEGLVEEARLGINPFQLGLIASTDTHLGTPGLVEESGAFPGHGGAGKATRKGKLPTGFPDHLDFNPGGLAGVWAEENSRGAIFAALQRRETFGTSGPRIPVRFFGGWDLPNDLCDRPDLVSEGYRRGTPMGGDLASPATSAAPSFVASALKDPGIAANPGTPLQRIQIIKGWIEQDGTRHERVIEVAGDPQNGADVDVDTCEPRGDGFDTLCGVWRDPDFDPSERAFYYARVVENPTCRWSQKLCRIQDVQCDEPASIPAGFEPCCAESHRRTIQERAWSSPIWYRPENPERPTPTMKP